MTELWVAVSLGLVIGLIAALIVVNYMASGLKSVHMQTSADLYCDAKNLRLEDRSEVFIGSRTEVVVKPKLQERR